MSREACPTYCAPWALAALALASADAGQPQALLQEGEDLLARDCVSHNYLEFYNLGIEVALRTNDPERATEVCVRALKTTREPNRYAGRTSSLREAVRWHRRLADESQEQAPLRARHWRQLSQ